MRRTTVLHDRSAIFAALREHRALHLYAIGDLDDFFFPFTSWYALEEDGSPLQVALVYSGGSTPSVLAIAPERTDEMRALLRSLLPLLPRRFYMHVTPGAARALEEAYELLPHGLHHKMVLAHPARLAGIETSRTEKLTTASLAEVEAFYAAAYPGNWFDPRMLETACYFGARESGALAAVAGVHVLSRTYGVAALGNIATLPASRGRGFGAAVVTALCRSLLADGLTIGLNVDAANAGAIRLYERLGFEVCGSYEEHEVVAK